MAIEGLQTINLGADPDDGTGDSLREAGAKINANFQLIGEEAGAGEAADIGYQQPGTGTVRRGLAIALGETVVNAMNFIGNTPGEKLERALKDMPIGAHLMIPNGAYVSRQGIPFTVNKICTITMQKDTSIIGLRAAGDPNPAVRIAVNQNTMGNESRGMTIYGNGGRIIFSNSGGGSPFVCGGHALAINDTGNENFPVIGMDVHGVQAVGGTKQAIGVYTGTAGKYVHFVRLWNCQATGGIYLNTADGVCVYNCHGIPGGADQPNFAFVEVDAIEGAYLVHVSGGTTQCRGGAVRIINGDFGIYEGIQAEYQPGASATNDVLFEVVGASRPAIGNLFRNNNCGPSSVGMLASFRIRNSYSTEIYGNQIAPARVVGDPAANNFADIIIEDTARGVIWGRNLYRGQGRSLITANEMTDATRRLRVQRQSAKVLAQGHVGLWIPIVVGVPSDTGNRGSGQNDFTPLRNWNPSADAKYFVPTDGGAVVAEGTLSGGTLAAGDIALLPEMSAPARQREILVETATGKALATIGPVGQLISQQAMPDNVIYLSRLYAQWQAQQQRQYTVGAA